MLTVAFARSPTATDSAQHACVRWQRERQRLVHGRVAGNANRMVELLSLVTQLRVTRDSACKSQRVPERSPNSQTRTRTLAADVHSLARHYGHRVFEHG